MASAFGIKADFSVNWTHRETDGAVLAIARNDDLSNGIMIPLEAQYDGKQLRGVPQSARGPGATLASRHSCSPGPWTPRIRMPSTSAVCEGPVTSTA